MPEGRSSHKFQFSDGAIALTFDDVLIRPGASNVMPGDADVASRVTRSISVNIPILCPMAVT